MHITGNVTAVVVTMFFFLCCGLWSLSKGLSLAWGLARQKRDGCVAEGTVTRNIEVRPGEDESPLVAEVEFRDAGGEYVRIRSRWAMHPAPFKVGEPALVVYDAGRPREARIVQEITSGAWWLVSVGAIGTLLMGLMLLSVRPS
jgi:hypothetical protein